MNVNNNINNNTNAKIMLMLVLALLFVAVAAADILTQPKYYGVDGVEGFLRRIDKRYIEVEVDNTTIGPFTVEIRHATENMLFDCSRKYTNIWTCIYQDEMPEQFDFGADNHIIYSVELLNRNRVAVSSKQIDFTIDDSPPVVSVFDVVLPDGKLGRKPVEIKFDVEDPAEYQGRSAGLLFLVYYIDGVGEINITEITGKFERTRSGSFMFDPSVIPENVVANVSFCLQAADWMQQLSDPKCQQVEIDRKAPDVTMINLTRHGVPVEYVGAYPIVLDRVYINVSDDSDVEKEGVKANFYELSDQNMNVYKEADGYDALIKQFYWENVHLKDGGDVRIYINVSDVLGNYQEIVAEKTIVKDDQPPVVEYFGTSLSLENGTSFVSNKNTFVMLIDEVGAGMFNHNIEVDFGNFATGEAVRKPECNLSGGRWICFWRDVNLKPGYTSKIATAVIRFVKDDVGNEADLVDLGGNTQTFVVSTEPPKLIDEFITNEEGYDYFTQGQSIVFRFVFDSQVPMAYGKANLSKLSNNLGEVVFQCEDRECFAQTDTLLETNRNVRIRFTFYNFANKSVTFERKLTVLEPPGTEDSGFYIAKVKRSGMVNRRTAQLTNEIVYFDFEFRSGRSGVRAVEIHVNPPSCIFGSNKDYIAHVNNIYGANSNHLVLEFIMNRMSMDVQFIPINCTFTVIARDSVKLYAPKLITFESYKDRDKGDTYIELYNLPMGDIGEGLRQEIKDLKGGKKKDRIRNLAESIETARKLCNYIGLINGIREVWNDIEVWLKSKDDLTEVAKTNACKQSEKASDTEIISIDSLDRFCDFVSCSKPLGKIVDGGEDIDKLNEIIEDVKKSLDIGGYVDYLSELGSPQGTSNDDEGEEEESSDLSYYEPAFSWVNPYSTERETLVGDVAKLCLPGILIKMNELNEIECKKAYCLQTLVPQGLPREICDQNYAFEKCKYWRGELFNFLPQTVVLDKIGRLIRNRMSNPLALFGLYAAKKCKKFCSNSNAHVFCQKVAYADYLGTTYGRIKSMQSQLKRLEDDEEKWRTNMNSYCDALK
ncbi:hypothetical protein DRJ17_04925 [Candidatus Woesearchaeota archaeon]|nr:MAG: hypothetical protein DRJ17_04925 [Candidatus Woesearchaeota archaeon]